MWSDIVLSAVLLLFAVSILLSVITKSPLISYKVTYYNHPKGGTETEDDAK